MSGRPDVPLLVDAHNDLLLEVAFRTYRQNESNPFASRWLPLLELGGVALQVCPMYADLSFLPEGALRQVLEQVAAFNRAVRESPDRVIAVRRRADLDRVERRERLGLMLALEGAESLGYEPRMAEVMWELGVRMMSLTWNRRNPFADGVAEPRGAGLSRLGEELVDLCVELGMMIDLAHASERTYWDVLERVSEGRVLVSHAACRSVHDHPRNLSDAQLEGLAHRGGVLGLMQLPVVIDPDSPTLPRVLDHLDHAVAVMGIDHVGLGADFTRQVLQALRWEDPPDSLLPEGMHADAAIEDLTGPEDYPNLVAALQERGYEASSLAALLGENFLRLFWKALPDT